MNHNDFFKKKYKDKIIRIKHYNSDMLSNIICIVGENGKKLFITRSQPKIYNQIYNENESYIEKKPNSNVRNGTKNLVGGILFFNKTSLINIGMENEKYVGWGGEDSDRYERARKLGLKCRRLTYNLYHINHKRGIFSRGHEKYHQNNKDELKYVRGLNAINLKKYIQNWEWYND